MATHRVKLTVDYLMGRLPTAEVVALMTGADQHEARRIGYIAEADEQERDLQAGLKPWTRREVRDGPDRPERC